MAEAVLELVGVAAQVGGTRVDDATFSVHQGTISALLGPSGSGKSALVDLITGSATPARGTIRFRGQAIHGLRPHLVARRGIVRTFERTPVFPSMSVEENVLIGAAGQAGETFIGVWFQPLAVHRHQTRARAEARGLLEAFGLGDRAADPAGSLPRSDRKLLELARVMMSQPALVILDEPLAGIDPVAGRHLLEHIQRLRDYQDMTFLFTERDIDVVMRYSERVIVVAGGAVIATGRPSEVRLDEQVANVYPPGVNQ